MDYEQMRKWRVELPRTAAAWKRGDEEDDLRDVLDDELCKQGAELVGDDACESGGWPEDEQVELTEVTVTKKTLIANVTVHFSEMIQTGCADIRNDENRVAHVVVTLDRGNDFGDVEYAPKPEFDDDRDRKTFGNSSRDGT